VTKPNLVIDASVVGNAGDDSPLGDTCFELLRRVIRIYQLLVDAEGYIQSEYEGLIAAKGRDSFAQRWWIEVQTTVGLRQQYSGKLTRAHLGALEKAGFHNDDYPYVAVAIAAKQATIVHEDTDYCNAESVITTLAAIRCVHPPMLLQELDHV